MYTNWYDSMGIFVHMTADKLLMKSIFDNPQCAKYILQKPVIFKHSKLKTLLKNITCPDI